MAGVARRRRLALALTSSVSAYVGQVPTTITLTPFRGTVPCDHYYSVVATVLDQNGKPIKNLTVNFAITSSPSTHDKLKPTSDETNKHGEAKVFIKYACVVGNRMITATVDGISASAVVFVKLRPKHHHDDDDDKDHHDGDKKLAAARVHRRRVAAEHLDVAGRRPDLEHDLQHDRADHPRGHRHPGGRGDHLRRLALSRR